MSSIIQDALLRLAAETPEWLQAAATSVSSSLHPVLPGCLLQHLHMLSVKSNSSAGRLRMEMMMEMDTEVPRWRGL